MKFREKYQKEIVPQLKKEFGYQNMFEVPRLEKAVVNVGMGKHSKEKEYIESVLKSLTMITGQKPVLTRARKSISSFKIREGNIVGATVTVRRERMYDLLQKLVSVTLPRVRDFQGLNKKSVDKGGNLTVGIREHMAFPEIKADEVDNLFGMEITFVTTARNREEGLELFRLLGIPFKKEK